MQQPGMMQQPPPGVPQPTFTPKVHEEEAQNRTGTNNDSSESSISHLEFDVARGLMQLGSNEEAG